MIKLEVGHSTVNFKSLEREVTRLHETQMEILKCLENIFRSDRNLEQQMRIYYARSTSWVQNLKVKRAQTENLNKDTTKETFERASTYESHSPELNRSKSRINLEVEESEKSEKI